MSLVNESIATVGRVETPPPTDSSFQVAVTVLPGQTLTQGDPICSVVFGTAYGCLPNVMVSTNGQTPAQFQVMSASSAGFQVICGDTINAPGPGAITLIIMFNVFPNCSDPSFT